MSPTRASAIEELPYIEYDPGYVAEDWRWNLLDRSWLFRYLVSYRKHAAFHETCVERIFVDVLEHCRPNALTVHARFLRRGGIDINPFRSNFESVSTATARTPRQ